MKKMETPNTEERGSLITPLSPVLVTGANGFIGSQVVRSLLIMGLRKVRCFVRPSSNTARLRSILADFPAAEAKIIEGNLLSPRDCSEACREVEVLFHLAAGIEKSFAGSFLNSVVTTRNLLEAVAGQASFRRFVNVSSFAVYSNWHLSRSAVLDEECPIEADPFARHEPYCYAKQRQEEIVRQYGRDRQVPYVVVRPGAVYGPGARQHLSPRVGIDTFGIFLHLGGPKHIPLSYVENCAEAIALAGMRPGIDGETINVVDDDLPTSRDFLKLYKEQVRNFPSLYVPYPIFYAFSALWEAYARWSRGQLPPVFNRRRCAAYWKGNQYSNRKAKRLLGWEPKVSSTEGMQRHYEYFRSLEVA